MELSVWYCLTVCEHVTQTPEHSLHLGHFLFQIGVPKVRHLDSYLGIQTTVN